MLNEPLGEMADIADIEGEMGAIGEETPQMNYIQVTPQEKEAIERVIILSWGSSGLGWRGLKKNTIAPLSRPAILLFIQNIYFLFQSQISQWFAA